ncbi:hypothetical protein IU487_02780 [Nocardia puris]|uniref:Uncharacterized protein n=1 Tax=Nocardia puris TaxID=208602 RepID=A0A366DYL1_9NOCA|nr:hypothetical protein [Nocardia puris]MBF6209978.1 hypothetical protein [Nocardia puris]RBO94278.1 hypothetical protein DFR74_102701 [Nocardia puris]
MAVVRVRLTGGDEIAQAVTSFNFPVATSNTNPSPRGRATHRRRCAKPWRGDSDRAHIDVGLDLNLG